MCSARSHCAVGSIEHTPGHRLLKEALSYARKGDTIVVWLVVLGEMTIHGNIQSVQSLAEPLQIIMDNGGRRVLLPTSNKRDLLEVPGDIVERVDPLFFSDPLQAALKALGLS